MNAEELKSLEREVSKLKFKAGQHASELHDLVEDRLLSDFEDLPKFADTTYQACKNWYDAKTRLDKLKKE